jgi:NTP pyrophosphatase (non-canonical NTP hydrolase)
MDIQETAKQVHEWAKSKGWWDGKRSIGDQFANFHAEISEAWEEYRNGRAMDWVYYSDDGKPEGIPIELADCIIRILDTCEAYSIDIEKALSIKMKYNEGRPYRHGGKKA